MPYRERSKQNEYRRKWYQAHAQGEIERIVGIRNKKGIRNTKTLKNLLRNPMPKLLRNPQDEVLRIPNDYERVYDE